MAQKKSVEKRGSAEEKFPMEIEKEVNEMTERKSAEKREPAMITEGEDEQSWMSHPVVVAVKRDLAKGKSALKLCVECGQAFVPTKGYRHCCSDACQKARIQAGSAKGAQVTKDIWAVEKMKTVVVELDAEDASGV